MRELRTIDCRDPAALDGAAPVRKLLLLVILLAIKDGASVVRFDPFPPGQRPDPGPAEGEDDADLTSEDGQACRISYEVGGIPYEMVPAPCSSPVLAGEMLNLAGVGAICLPLRHLFRRLAAAFRPGFFLPAEGRLRVLLGGEAVLVAWSVEPDQADPAACRVSLRLADARRASAAAAEVLNRCLCWAAAGNV